MRSHLEIVAFTKDLVLAFILFFMLGYAFPKDISFSVENMIGCFILSFLILSFFYHFFCYYHYMEETETMDVDVMGEIDD